MVLLDVELYFVVRSSCILPSVAKTPPKQPDLSPL
jgi:hypothetical protein